MIKLILMTSVFFTFCAYAANPISLTEYLNKPSNPLKINF